MTDLELILMALGLGGVLGGAIIFVTEKWHFRTSGWYEVPRPEDVPLGGCQAFSKEAE